VTPVLLAVGYLAMGAVTWSALVSAHLRTRDLTRRDHATYVMFSTAWPVVLVVWGLRSVSVLWDRIDSDEVVRHRKGDR
jgi:hypothetical protein